MVYICFLYTYKCMCIIYISVCSCMWKCYVPCVFEFMRVIWSVFSMDYIIHLAWMCKERVWNRFYKEKGIFKSYTPQVHRRVRRNNDHRGIHGWCTRLCTLGGPTRLGTRLHTRPCIFPVFAQWSSFSKINPFRVKYVLYHCI